MTDPSPDRTFPEDGYPQPEPKKPLNGWLIALVVILALIVLCCICLFALVAGLTLMGPAVGNTFSTIIEEMVTVTPLP
ncbi:MAG: hypothetical protein PVI09_21790 [Anaerolineae bacterium]|jgi:hypothetical protein